MSPDTKRVLRTALQIIVGLASALPLLVHTANLPDTLPGLGVALAVAGIITKAMAKWNGLLPAWLQVEAPPAWSAADVASGSRHAGGTMAAPPLDRQPPAPTSATVYTPVTAPATATTAAGTDATPSPRDGTNN